MPLLLPFNPALKVEQYREAEPRQRVLFADELARLLEVIERHDEPFVRAALLLLMQAGLRRSEALTLRWDDVDLVGGVLHLRSTKAGRPQAIPIAAQTVDMLGGLKRLGPWVFPGRDPKEHRTTLHKPWRTILRLARIEGVTIHDLRRTFGLAVARKHGLTGHDHCGTRTSGSPPRPMHRLASRGSARGGGGAGGGVVAVKESRSHGR